MSVRKIYTRRITRERFARAAWRNFWDCLRRKEVPVFGFVLFSKKNTFKQFVYSRIQGSMHYTNLHTMLTTLEDRRTDRLDLCVSYVLIYTPIDICTTDMYPS